MLNARSAWFLTIVLLAPWALSGDPGSGLAARMSEPNQEAPPAQEALPAAAGAQVRLIRVDEPITPTTNDYIRRALAETRAVGAAALIIELDTPGGLLESTREIVQALFESEVPVVVYVTPGGARAASAGTFITMAAHVAAMAPSTTIGAASPVSLGDVQMDTVMQSKAFSYAESFIATIAERRGRNVEWAISAVREAVSVTEREALELGVIDLVAQDRLELLQCHRRLRHRRRHAEYCRGRGGRDPEKSGRAVPGLHHPSGADADPHDDRHLRHHWRSDEPWRHRARGDGRHRAHPASVRFRCDARQPGRVPSTGFGGGALRLRGVHPRPSAS
jgi:ATP-dependent protease ClpP protease subunit